MEREPKRLQRNIIEEAKARFNKIGSSIINDVLPIEPGTEVDPLNAPRVSILERKQQLTTWKRIVRIPRIGQPGQQDRREEKVVLSLVKGGIGHCHPKSKSKAQKFKPLFEQILQEDGTTNIPPQNLSISQEQVRKGRSIMHRVELAQNERKRIRDLNKHVREQNRKRTIAQRIYEDSILAWNDDQNKEKTEEKSHLAETARATLWLQPGSRDVIQFNPVKGSFHIRTNRRIGETEIEPESLIRGTTRLQVERSPWTNFVNRIRCFFGIEPYSPSRGTLCLVDVFNDEVIAEAFVEKPDEKYRLMTNTVEAIRVTRQRIPERQRVPNFSDLGLDGKMLDQISRRHGNNAKR